MSEPLIIIGHGGFGREIAAWIRAEDMPYVVSGFLDDTHEADVVLGSLSGHEPSGGHKYLTAFGDGAARVRVRGEFEERGAVFATLISPSVKAASPLADSVNGIFLGCCSISSSVQFGNDVLVQGFACVGHDVSIGDGVTISSHAFIGGGACLGRLCTIHPHAVVLPNVSVGEGAVVGAGAVVIKDVAPHTTVFGSPAKVIAYGKSDAA